MQVNAPNLLLNEYNNITVIDKVTDITIDDTNITMMPWICDDNMQEIMSAIKETDSKICMGHLELKGFMAHPVMCMSMDLIWVCSASLMLFALVTITPNHF